MRPDAVYSKAGFMNFFYFDVFLRFVLYNPLKTWCLYGKILSIIQTKFKNSAMHGEQYTAPKIHSGQWISARELFARIYTPDRWYMDRPFVIFKTSTRIQEITNSKGNEL